MGVYVYVRVCVREREREWTWRQGKRGPFDGNVDDVILVITTSAKETNKLVTDYGLTVLMVLV